MAQVLDAIYADLSKENFRLKYSEKLGKMSLYNERGQDITSASIKTSDPNVIKTLSKIYSYLEHRFGKVVNKWKSSMESKNGVSFNILNGQELLISRDFISE